MAQNVMRENIHELVLRKIDEIVAGSKLAISTVLEKIGREIFDRFNKFVDIFLVKN